MKHYILLIAAACGLQLSILHAQCPGTPDPGCINTNGPCGNLHTGNVGQYYNDTISFWAPRRVDASVQSGGLFDSLDFVQFQIANVTGLPVGLSWSCGNGSCVYNPQPNGILCNITICGTPISAGTYNLTVYTVGTVSTPIGNQSGNQNFNLTLAVTQGVGGNNAFTFSPSQGCDSVQVTFAPTLNFPLPQITEWLWDFGGGNTYNGQNPPPQSFLTPGIYPVTCTTNVYNMVLQSLNISVGGTSWWCGDIEELNCGNGNADIVPTFTTGANSWTGNEVADNPNPSWSGINFILTGISYSISLEEIDAISQNDHPAGPYSGTVTGPGTYSFNYPSNFSGSFTIGLSLANQIIVTDTVIVYASPVMDTINANNLTLCPGEAATMSVYPGMLYEWTLNDTLLVQAGNDNTYTTSQVGSYKVKIIDPVSGCYVITDPVTVTSLTGVPPGFGTVGISLSGGTLNTALSGSYTYQWLYYDGISYSQIPAPEGIAPSYTPQFNGTYCLIATNQFGCTDTSNCITLTLGLDDPFAGNKVNLYPNPAGNTVNLFIQELNTDAELVIYSTLGSSMLTEFIPNPSGSLTHEVNLEQLSPGMYLVEIKAAGYRTVLRLVKN